jgi:hypothetical protein
VLKSNAPGEDTEAITDRSIVHTSGIYRIDEAEHIISAGMFRTNLNLYRESGFFGAGELGRRLRATFPAAASAVDSVVAKVSNLLDDLF